jgi:hypothetical protein
MGLVHEAAMGMPSDWSHDSSRLEDCRHDASPFHRGWSPIRTILAVRSRRGSASRKAETRFPEPPDIIRQIIELAMGRNWQKQNLGLRFGRNFGNGYRVGDHFDRASQIELSDDDQAALGVSFKQATRRSGSPLGPHVEGGF